jgi:adenosylcobinamide-GDP ribazoletransferase
VTRFSAEDGSGVPLAADARRGPFDDFAAAAGLLTRLPVGAGTAGPGAIAAASWAFPLVGAGIGAVCALVFFVAEAVGLADAPAAVLALAAGIGLTGALHEDGLADTADGFGGGVGREAKLAIMRDSRHGTYGILALGLSLGLRAAALATIGGPIAAGLALIAAHAASRGALPVLMRLMRPARTDGLGATAGRPGRFVALLAVVFGTGIALAMLGPGHGAVSLVVAGIAVALAAWLARRQIGGYTGDVLGSFQQIGEIVMLLAAAAQ